VIEPGESLDRNSFATEFELARGLEAGEGVVVAGIVVGIDGSEQSVSALSWAAKEAKLRGSVLHVVAVFSGAILSTGYEMATTDLSDYAAATNIMLGAAVDTVREFGDLEGVEVTTEVLEGHAGELLISVSKESDLLVVGSRGHGGFVGLLIGSVTTYVVNHAHCPVVVVRST
jgi:nucleotide-binding universal stress UspA family protein